MPKWPGHRRRQVRYRACAQHGGPDSPGVSAERVQVGGQRETSRHLNERVIPLCRVEIQASLDIFVFEKRVAFEDFVPRSDRSSAFPARSPR